MAGLRAGPADEPAMVVGDEVQLGVVPQDRDGKRLVRREPGPTVVVSKLGVTLGEAGEMFDGPAVQRPPRGALVAREPVPERPAARRTQAQAERVRLRRHAHQWLAAAGEAPLLISQQRPADAPPAAEA